MLLILTETASWQKLHKKIMTYEDDVHSIDKEKEIKEGVE